MPEQVTAGPVRADQNCSFGVHPRLYIGLDGRGKLVAVFGNAEGIPEGLPPQDEWEANAKHVETLWNAAYSINPADPMAVAGEVGEAFRLLRCLSDFADIEDLPYGTDIRALLQRISGGGDGSTN